MKNENKIKKNYPAGTLLFVPLFLAAGICLLAFPENALPYITNISVEGIPSEVMLNYLSGLGICVSSGSACSSHSQKVSRALSAFGLSDRAADCTLRVSLSNDNTAADIDALCDALADGVSSLIRIH